MPWVALTLKIDAAHAEILSDALLALGALSTDLRDAAAGTEHEQPLFDEPCAPEGSAGSIWPVSELTALFPADTDIASVMCTATQALGLPNPPPCHVTTVEEQDWVRTTQSQFDPIRISSRLWIVPTWHRAPDPAAVNLVLDPGIAFGTGSHPTTQLCLAWLDENLHGEEDVLDYGCGSGILGIAAWKLGARRVIGVDIDAQAIAASRSNAALNRCDAARVTFQAAHAETSNPAHGTQVDVVVANILANPLVMLAPILAQATRPQGRIVLSGILDTQAQEIEHAYRPWFRMSPSGRCEGWVLLAGIKEY
ncbi:50S ribosomal protein L11 methyltransferase [Nitrosovibrio sp. Nv17]|jgi:ribosomal protein L11 methyltransferase|uniref:50S ribosomal protein L11 methyltransferase n=1 Tax=Nitrosovibrio sp. Nv17 TaxID=1855339 RepID=UPI000908780C|nr:50S ribosomal protein L11 methyltransferase [Nitrosovibrio sp. Nv17]SFW31243.1 [LSU ribosomal protein L11P]-lysine N-methyltransferase [Nitrosovibrio sp. Nv17]